MKFSNSYFSIDIEFRPHSVVLQMTVKEDMCHTDCFSDVVPFLHTHVPDVLHTKCFNPRHLSFKEEVLNTEFGHLFEHMLISILCDETIKAGAKTAHYRANTTWNWHTSPRGTFEITINASIDPLVFAIAIKKTIAHATSMCKSQFKTKAAATVIAAA